MQIPRKYIDNFTKALNKLTADAQKRLADDLAKINFDGNIATIRDMLITRMEFYCGPYTDMAAIVAAEFYDGLRKFQTGAALGALAESGREPIATEKAVRAIMQDVVEGKPTEVVVRKLIDRVDYEIKKSAGECVYRNGKRDPLKPRYARVPSGGETCEFCIMLASRGFVYLSEESARDKKGGGHYHANCDCRIVPGFDGETTIPGYDPDKLYDQWKNPEKYPELREARNERRRELYAEKKGKAHGVSKQEKPSGEPSLIAASPVYLSKADDLYERMQKVKPIEGYTDFGLHCDGRRFTRIQGSDEWISAEDIAEWIKADPRYQGGPIRLLSCMAGKYSDGPAQEIADKLGAEVLAPTETLFINHLGEYNVARTYELSEMIFAGEAEEIDGWATFKPRKGGE